MDTRYLETFLMVVESNSLADAARRLNISPATLALRIQSLEDDLGFELVARSGRTVQPTPAGRALAGRAAGLLRDLRELRTLGGDQHLKGELRLGVAQTAISAILCRVLPIVASKYPDLEISVVKGSSADIYQKIENSDLDAGYIFHPPFKLPKLYEWQSFRTEPYIVIAPSGSAGSDPLGLLREMPFVRYDRSLWSGQIAESYLRRMQIHPRERIELDSLEAIAVLVDGGLGVSLVPDWAPPWPEGLTLTKLALDSAPIRELGLLWRRSSALLRLIEIVKAETLLVAQAQRRSSPQAPRPASVVHSGGHL